MPWRRPSGRGAARASELSSITPIAASSTWLSAYTERLAGAGALTSVGSRGDPYDNARFESFYGLYKAELIRKDGPWAGHDDVEFATLEYVDWFNHLRLHTELGMRPPVEFEAE